MRNDDFSIEFSDRTLIETDGEYDSVAELCLDSPDWMLRTDAVISNNAGSCFFVLHFYANKDVYIINYLTSLPDVFYNPDIQYLSAWTQSHGWNAPRPHNDLVKDDIQLWKHFWETMLVDSEILDSKYGERLKYLQEPEEDEDF